MKTNNGWISVLDSEKPESCEEILVLEYCGNFPIPEEPFAAESDRVYTICTWYEPGDVYYNEDPEHPMDYFYGGGAVTVEEAGFYVCESKGPRNAMTWRKLKTSTDGITDGIACWKHMDYPTME